MAKKPARLSEFKTVVYSSQRWTLLQDMRRKAVQLMEPLDASHLEAVVHGSIARGDVSSKSDIDIFIPSPSSSFAVETCVGKYNITVNRRLVVQATPNYTMKAHIEIDEKTTVTFPLMKMRKTEREFYRFGGEANLERLKKDLRVPGVDKRLMFIEPTDKGHAESAITGREEQVAHTLGISVETVSDRVHALLRRDKIGRTGVFIKEELSESETFEMLLEKLARKNPAVRRRLASQK